MPVIPTYEAQAQLDPDARGMPHVNFDESEFRAAQQQGAALQGLGSELSSLGQRAAQMQQQQADFATGLQSRALQQDLTTAFQKGAETMPANGTGFTQGFLTQADQIAQQRFDQMPAGPARDRAMQEWQAIGREAWGNQAATAEHKQSGLYSTQQIGQMQDTDLQSVSKNPAMADGLMEQARSQIMNAPGLTTAQKMAALADYQRNLYGTELQTRFGTDGEGMRSVLGMAPPGSASATFSRMLGVENAPGDPGAVSGKGALGLAQVMPETAREVAHDLGMTQVAGMSDSQLQAFFADHPDVNRQIGRAYFGQMLKRYDGNQEAAVIAYNAGPARADAWLRKGDEVLPAETIAYRDKVLGPDRDATHAVTTSNSPLGSVAFDGSSATINGKTFSTPSPVVAVARQFAGMNEKTNRDTLSAFMQKSCGQQVDPAHIPWCASFADAVLGASGKATLGSARAADFLNYGSPTNAPSQGDVVVFKPQAAGRSGHVGFVVGVEGDQVRYIAGNDGNGVRENTLPLSQVAGFRVPPPAQNAGQNGGVFTGRYAALTFADRQRLVASADAGERQMQAQQQQQFKLDSYNTQKLVDDDVQSLAATGQGAGTLDPNRVAAVLGPEKAQKWQEERAQALDTFKGTSGMDALSNDEITDRIEQLRPGQADAGEGFTRKQKVFEAVQKQGQDIIKQRAADPALVVERTPAVMQAKRLVNPADSTSYRPVIAARMAQQASIGIPEGQRQPLTKDEALRVMAPVNNAPAGLDGPAMRQAIDHIEAMAGPVFAPRALQFALEQAKVDNETAKMLSALMIKAQKGQPVTQTDMDRLTSVSAGVALRNSPFMGGDSGRRGIGSDAVFDPAGPQPAPPDQAAASPADNGQAASLPADAGQARIVPPDDAIRALIRNPSRADDFDAVFGKGSARRALEQWRKMTGRPNG